MDLQKCQKFVTELAVLRDEAAVNSSPANVRSLLKRLALIYDVARGSEPTFAAGIFQTMAACLPLAEAVLESGIAPGSTVMVARQARLRQALDEVVVTGARLAGMAPPPAKSVSAQAPVWQAPSVAQVSAAAAPASAPARAKSETPLPGLPVASAPAVTQPVVAQKETLPQKEARFQQEAQARQGLEALKRERDEAIQAEIEARTEYHRACQQLNRLREVNSALQQQVKRAAVEHEALEPLQQQLKQALAEREALQRNLEIANRQAEERERAAAERLNERDQRIEALQRQTLAEPDPTALQSGLQAARAALPQSLQRHVDGLLALMPVVEQGDSALETKVDAIDRWVYQSAEAVGVLMAKGLAEPAVLHQVVAAQRLLHGQLEQLGLLLICPAAGAPFDAALHDCPERDIVYVNEGPREDRVLALMHVGFRSTRTDVVLRRAQVKRSVYVGDIEETESAPDSTVQENLGEPGSS